jgi:hypothetical protein
MDDVKLLLLLLLLLLIPCSSTTSSAQLTAHVLVRLFKTEPTETVAFSFGLWIGPKKNVSSRSQFSSANSA